MTEPLLEKTPSASPADPAASAPRGPRRRPRALLRRPVVLFAYVVFGLYVVAACLGSWLTPQDPAQQSLSGRLLAPGSSTERGVHLLGTDQLGRDMLALLVGGARSAIVPAALAILLAAVVGVLLGMLAAYAGGRSADLLLFVTNTQLSFPFFLLALAVVGILGPSFLLLVVVIALGDWVQFARIIYSETQELRELEYIRAVRVMRGSHARAVFRHILPNLVPSIIVIASFGFGNAIITISSLEFLGLSPPAAFPGWGAELSDGRDYLSSAWWLTVLPGAAVFFLVLSVNVLGETFRDRFGRGTSRA